MRELMYQTWPDSNRRWHWVAFSSDPFDTVESRFTFDNSEEARWDAERFIEALH